jgi:hypothetical protein
MRTSSGLALVLAMIVAGAASAQVPPMYIGVTNGILDEFDALLDGTCAAAVPYGYPHVTGDVVQILKAPLGVFPPASDGTPSTNNPVLYASRIGIGVDPALGRCGLFGAMLPVNNKSGDPLERTSIGPIFVRVFNAPSLGASSFYGDSQVWTPGASFNYPFVASVAKTGLPLDEGDPDGDGLNNSWEKSLGANTESADSDGDGMSDGTEFTAGTDLLDPKSYLAMVQIMSAGGSDAFVRWDAVPGKYYRIEYTSADLTEPAAYESLTGPILATNTTMRVLIPNGMSSSKGHYRVCLEPAPSP